MTANHYWSSLPWLLSLWLACVLWFAPGIGREEHGPWTMRALFCHIVGMVQYTKEAIIFSLFQIIHLSITAGFLFLGAVVGIFIENEFNQYG